MARLIIEAGRAERHYWADLWRFRELFYFLAWRDVLVRYKQTAIGILWALLRPLITMIVFTVIFRRIAGLPGEGVPYPLLIFAAMLPWQFFASAITEASASLVGNANLIAKIYFPRLIVPTSAIIVSLVDVLVSCGLLAGLFAWYDFWPTWRIVMLPLLLALTFLAALGPGLLITALNVQYRDFRYVVPFIVQFGLFISPVGFSSALIPERWRLLYYLNPVAGIIDAFRWAICGTPVHYAPGLILSLAVTAGCLVGGIHYFRRMERTFADVI
jgi:lipopolysaccharide transport system permease protein